MIATETVPAGTSEVVPKPRWRDRFTPLTVGLILANAWLFALPSILGLVPWGETLKPGARSSIEAHLRMGGGIPLEALQHEPWRVLTAPFLHGWAPHLMLNMFIFMSFGLLLHRLAGARRFLWVYLISGAVGALASASQHATISVGASGAILGVAAACLSTLVRRHRELPPGMARGVGLPLTLMLGLLVGTGFLFRQMGGVAVDNAAHVGGAVSGLVLGLLPTVRRYRTMGTVLTWVGALVLLVSISIPAGIALLGGGNGEWEAEPTVHTAVDEIGLELPLTRWWAEYQDPLEHRPKALLGGWRNLYQDQIRVYIDRRPRRRLLITQVDDIESQLVEQTDYRAVRLRRREIPDGPGGILIAYRLGPVEPNEFAEWFGSQDRIRVWRFIETRRGTVEVVLDTGASEDELYRGVELLSRLRVVR